MIYNTELTKSLVDLFGIDVLEWSKNKIRNSLEDRVHNLSEQILHGDEESYSIETLKLYKDVKDLDNEFTLLYTNEITINK